MKITTLILLFVSLFTVITSAHAELAVGQKAPEFSSVDEVGLPITLAQFKGKTVVLYFYPRDNTPGCTAEAQSFRDHFAEFEKQNIVVIGVSFNDAEKHQKFKAEHDLPFPLLAKNQKEIAELYDVGGMWFANRDTIIIGPDGLIKGIYRSVKASDHAQFVLDQIRKK